MIDAGVVFEELFCRNIVHICFGEDITDMQFDVDVLSESGDELIRKKLTLPECIHEFDDQIFGLLT